MRERVPTTRGDITVRTEHTTAIGTCAHCSGLVRLAYNGDELRSSVAHAHPICDDWQRGGTLSLARTASPEWAATWGTSPDGERS